MKKSMVLIMVAGFGLLVAGCATKSPYVGTWIGEVAPGSAMLLSMTEEGHFVAETANDGAVFLGGWEATDNGQAKVVIAGRESGDIVVTLVKDNVIVLTDDKQSVKFIRQ